MAYGVKMAVWPDVESTLEKVLSKDGSLSIVSENIYSKYIFSAAIASGERKPVNLLTGCERIGVLLLANIPFTFDPASGSMVTLYEVEILLGDGGYSVRYNIPYA